MVAGSVDTNEKNIKLCFAAELADVLRKRRNRPDASDEDLGLPQSPSSPRRLHDDTQTQQIHTLANFDTNAEGCEGLFCTSTANNSINPQYEELAASLEERSKTVALTNSRYAHRSAQINVSTDISKRHTLGSSTFQEIADELDAPRLSHDGAKHKMALRQKKKAPSRLQRRTIDTTIPEVNENLVRIPAARAYFEDNKIKTQSLPPHVEPSVVPERKDFIEQHANPLIPPLTGTTGAVNLAQFYRKRSRDQLGAPHMETTQFPIFNIRTITTKAGQRPQAATVELGLSRENLMNNSILPSVTLRSSNHALNKDEDECDNQAKHSRKSCTELCCAQAAKDARKEKRDVSNEPKAGLGALLNNIKMITNEAKAAVNSPTKAKSGPEARQRYAPISIHLPEPDSTTALSNCQNVIREQREKDRFKSTAMVKHIAAAQQSPREFNDLNFERRPRTVNLNSYKQKAYSSYEPDVQAPTRFMEVGEEKEANCRKPVEKSRSFKFAEDRNSPGANNNMPSLPDLSARQLETTYFSKTSPTQDKSVSLGFEINDNNLMRRTEQTTNKNNTQLSAKITPYASKSAMDLSTRVLVPENSGSNRDITEIEQNIDMIVKSSPIISVVERSVNIDNPQVTSSKSSEDLTRTSKSRPNRLSLKMEPNGTLLNLMPVPHREKETMLHKKYLNVADNSTAQKRKSVPIYHAFKEEQEKQVTVANETKRSMSPSDHINSKVDLPEFLKIHLNPICTANKASEHVVLAKNVRSPVMQSKEASPSPSSSSNGTTTTSINSGSRDGSISPISKHFLDNYVNNAKSLKRHDSNESIEIKEQAAAMKGPPKIVEAINGDARAIVSHFLTRNNLKTTPDTAAASEIQKSRAASRPTTPTSPKIASSPSTPITPNTPTSPQRNRTSLSFQSSRNENMPRKPENTNPTVHNIRSFSLQERRRMFLNEDSSKTDKKVEELRTERKKSISEEVLQRKEAFKPAGSIKQTILKTPDLESKIIQKSAQARKPTTNTPAAKSKFEVIKSVVERKKERLDSVNGALKPPTVLRQSSDESETGFTTETKPRMQKTTNMTTPPNSELKENSTVVLRKKIATSQLPIAERLQSVVQSNSPRKVNSRNDEPELMKVFARRSLKVKDEDINNLSERIQANNSTASRKTICVSTHGVDSDKENQSASIERLNKLMHMTCNSEQELNIQSNNNNNIISNESPEPNVKLHNNNNGTSMPLSPSKVISPTAENNKLNNNNNNTNSTYRSKSFFSCELGKHNGGNTDVNNGNAIQNGTAKKSTSLATTSPKGKLQAMAERSMTMGEFKNIHQRRAEWEQRAKGVKN